MATVLGMHPKLITHLPENLLLEIFTYMAVKDLCSVGRVCRTWRRVVNDNSLWRHVDLKEYKLNLPRMWKVIRAHFSGVLISLHLRGYMDKAVANWKKNNLSIAMMKELSERCPNISHLELVKANLTTVPATTIPSTITKLTITNSLVPNGWFKEVCEDQLLPGLVEIDLSNSTKTTNEDVKHLSLITKLEVLKINGCYRVKEDGIKSIGENCKGLVVLEISGTGCTDVAIHIICRNLIKLERLNLEACHQVKDGSMDTIVTCLKKLKWINVKQCGGITPAGIMKLSSTDIILSI